MVFLWIIFQQKVSDLRTEKFRSYAEQIKERIRHLGSQPKPTQSKRRRKKFWNGKNRIQNVDQTNTFYTELFSIILDSLLA